MPGRIARIAPPFALVERGTSPRRSEIAGRVASAPTWSLRAPARTAGTRGAKWLLRKEVIQPHLPVRLPCYDFTPIASPTFDGSLPEGLGHRLRVLPTFVV